MISQMTTLALGQQRNRHGLVVHKESSSKLGREAPRGCLGDTLLRGWSVTAEQFLAEMKEEKGKGEGSKKEKIRGFVAVSAKGGGAEWRSRQASLARW